MTSAELSGDNGRALRWEALRNARDLGGLPAAGHVVRRGAIVRSDALYMLKDPGRAALVAHGIRTVIDMRAQREVDANSYAFDEASGVMRHHIPQQSEEMWAATRGLDRITSDDDWLPVLPPDDRMRGRNTSMAWLATRAHS